MTERKHVPPPTAFGPGRSELQAKAQRQVGFAPPPTQYGNAIAQRSPTQPSGRTASTIPSTRFGAVTPPHATPAKPASRTITPAPTERRASIVQRMEDEPFGGLSFDVEKQPVPDSYLNQQLLDHHENMKKGNAEELELLRLLVDPLDGKEKPDEARQAMDFQKEIGIKLARVPKGYYGDFVGIEGKYKGKTFDFFGITKAGASAYESSDHKVRESNKYISGLKSHYAKSDIDYIALDVRHTPQDIWKRQAEYFRDPSNKTSLEERTIILMKPMAPASKGRRIR